MRFPYYLFAASATSFFLATLASGSFCLGASIITSYLVFAVVPKLVPSATSIARAVGFFGLWAISVGIMQDYNFSEATLAEGLV